MESQKPHPQIDLLHKSLARNLQRTGVCIQGAEAILSLWPVVDMSGGDRGSWDSTEEGLKAWQGCKEAGRVGSLSPGDAALRALPTQSYELSCRETF